MKKWLNSLLGLIFPSRCEVCRRANDKTICEECFRQIKFMKPHLGIYSVSVYEGTLRTAIHRFKFKKRKNLAEALGIILVKYISHNPSLNMEEMDLIAPVPLHRHRLRQRGFDQVKLLANILNKYFGVPVIDALERVRNTKAQFDLPRGERFKNVHQAFKVLNKTDVAGKRVLLLDDIYTTGATIFECSKALKAAGARRVEILTLSRATD